MKMIKVAFFVTAAIALAVGFGYAGEMTQQAGAFASYQNSKDLDNGNGIGMNYAITFQKIMPKLAVGADLRVSSMAFNKEYNDYGVDLDVMPVELSLVAQYEFLAGSKPYVGIGAGYYVFDSDQIDVGYEVGCFGILGYTQQIEGHVWIFVEAKYLLLKPAVNGPFPMDDVDLSGVGANVGVAMNW